MIVKQRASKSSLTRNFFSGLLQELAISPDSKLIAVGTRGNRIFLLDAEKGIIQSVFKYQNGEISQLFTSIMSQFRRNLCFGIQSR